MAPLTAQAIADGATTLFQATFHVADLLVKVDFLTRTASGWHLIEVKSSTKYKPEAHLADVAFQWYVLHQVGLPLAQANLMHLNSDCCHPDLSNLFARTDITAEVQAHQPQVAADVAVMRQIVGRTEAPLVGIGRHCRQPAACAYYAHCWQEVDAPTIYDIPYLKRPMEEQLETTGIRYVAHIPPDFALGDKRAAAFVAQWQGRQSSLTGKPFTANWRRWSSRFISSTLRQLLTPSPSSPAANRTRKPHSNIAATCCTPTAH